MQMLYKFLIIRKQSLPGNEVMMMRHTVKPIKLRFLSFPLILLAAVIGGGLVGYFMHADTHYLKPLSNIFLNLIFTVIVPFIFFSVSSAITRATLSGKLNKIIFYMFFIFIFTEMVAALFAIVVVKLYPPAQNISLPLATDKIDVNFFSQIANLVTVSDFSKLLSHENMLSLIIFSILVGFASSTTADKGKMFATFLQAGEAIFMRVFMLIMYFAPVGFFAYFAVLVSELGPKFATNYFRIAILYYVFSLSYFVIIFTCYAFLAGKTFGVRLFWKNAFLPMVTSIATCSSIASIPANLNASKEMGVSPEIYQTMIPLGAVLHKNGSVIGGVIKIAFLFGIFHLDFSGITVLLTAAFVSLLVGTVMGAIPSGGMLGELLILSAYGFPSSVLFAIATISIIIDPLATMLNVVGNSVSVMLLARLMGDKNFNKKINGTYDVKE